MENLIIGKLVASLISILTIIFVFYSYTTLFGLELLIVDIVSFILGVTLGQLASYKIITKKKLSNKLTFLSWMIIVIFCLIFFIFTYFPPHLPIFRDSATGFYGILEHI
jgi:hypothetical protein